MTRLCAWGRGESRNLGKAFITHYLWPCIAYALVAIAVTVLVDIVFPEQNHIGDVVLHAVCGGEDVLSVDQ